MRDLISRFPMFVIVVMVFSLAMLFPAFVAWEYSQWREMWIFIRTSAFVFVIAVIFGILLMGGESRYEFRDNLINLFLVYLILPPILALPIVQITDRFDFWQASFEMLSSLTTTGASLIDTSSGLMFPILIWSALVAWLGAFYLLIVIWSIMEPEQIGGFELISDIETGEAARYTGGIRRQSHAMYSYFLMLAPPYVLATAFLAFLLAVSEERVMFALIHAWSVMSSSGVSPYAHLGETDMHIFGELVMFVFLFFGVSRFFLLDLSRGRFPKFRIHDPEMRVFMILMLLSLIIFAYFFLVQEFETRSLPSLGDFALSMWGMLFTVVSFMTTHGYVSEYWQFEVNNIEIHTSSIYLIGIAMLGGGVATTAGGIKLLRIYALSRLAARELGRMIDPESIAPSGTTGRKLRRRGGLNAFVFLMLFIAGVSLTALLLSASGMDFEESLMSAIAATTNCGPILNMLPDHIVNLTEAPDFYLGIFSLAMIFGRVEVFVLIAFFNPSFWQDRR